MNSINSIEDFFSFLYPTFVEEGKIVIPILKEEMNFFSVNDTKGISTFINEKVNEEKDVYFNVALQNELDAKSNRLNSPKMKRNIYKEIYKRKIQTKEDKENVTKLEVAIKKEKLYKGLIADSKSEPLIKIHKELLEEVKKIKKLILTDQQIEEFAKKVYKEDKMVVKDYITETLKYTRGSTKSTNAVFGFWLDIDINVEGHHKKTTNMFNSFREAYNFLFSLQVTPNILVNSGGGYHAYYVLDRVKLLNNYEDRILFEKKAKLFARTIKIKATKQNCGDSIDITSDLARMLRVPFTKNFKRISEGVAKDVKIDFFNNKKYSMKKIEEMIDVEILEKWEENEKNKKRKEIQFNKESPLILTMNNVTKKIETTNKKNNIKADADLMRSRCSFIDYCVTEQNSISYHEWFAFIQIVIHAENGINKVHEWSKEHNEYDEHELNNIIENLIDNEYSPTTTKRIREDIGYTECENCLCNFVTSPISLGYQNYKRHII